MSLHNRNMKHARAIEFDWTNLLAIYIYVIICIKFKEFARLTSKRKTNIRETGFYCPSNRNCRCVMKVYCYYFQGQTKYTWATCKLKLPNVAVYYITKEIHLAELHIQTLTFLTVLTLKQYLTFFFSSDFIVGRYCFGQRFI